MAITQSALAHAMARDLVRAAPPEAGIKRVWVWSQHGYVDPARDYVELAVLHDEMDEETQNRFLKAVVDVIDDGYPDVNKQLSLSCQITTAISTWMSGSDPAWKKSSLASGRSGALIGHQTPLSNGTWSRYDVRRAV